MEAAPVIFLLVTIPAFCVGRIEKRVGADLRVLHPAGQ